MGLFGPNIKKLETKGDVMALCEALRHRDSDVRSAAVALGVLGVEPPARIGCPRCGSEVGETKGRR